MASDKTALRRHPERSVTEIAAIHAVLDEGFVCHVGYLNEDRPVVVPTLYARDADRILLHGSTSSGIVQAVRSGSPLSVAVTLIDGLVVARSAFQSSANYRSVVVHGYGTILEGEEHLKALDIIVEGLIPGRVADIRRHKDIETRQTATVAVPLTEMSTKTRTGPPSDDQKDLNSEVWAGVIPMNLVAGEPESAPDLKIGIPIPDYLNPYLR